MVGIDFAEGMLREAPGELRLAAGDALRLPFAGRSVRRRRQRASSCAIWPTCQAASPSRFASCKPGGAPGRARNHAWPARPAASSVSLLFPAAGAAARPADRGRSVGLHLSARVDPGVPRAVATGRPAARSRPDRRTRAATGLGQHCGYVGTYASYAVALQEAQHETRGWATPGRERCGASGRFRTGRGRGGPGTPSSTNRGLGACRRWRGALRQRRRATRWRGGRGRRWRRCRPLGLERQLPAHAATGHIHRERVGPGRRCQSTVRERRRRGDHRHRHPGSGRWHFGLRARLRRHSTCVADLHPHRHGGPVQPTPTPQPSATPVPAPPARRSAPGRSADRPTSPGRAARPAARVAPQRRCADSPLADHSSRSCRPSRIGLAAQTGVSESRKIAKCSSARPAPMATQLSGSSAT